MRHALHLDTERHVAAVGASPPARPLSQLVGAWLAEGIITPEQARLMRRRGDVIVDVAAAEEPPVRSSLVVEALGYLGGVIVLAGTMLTTAQFWSDLDTATRLGVVGGAAAALLVAGTAVPQRLGDVAVRLRSVLWLLGTGACAGFLALLTADALELDSGDAAVATAAGTALVAAALWAAHRVLVQQVAMMVALMVSASTGIAEWVDSQELPGLGVWAVGAAWLALAWGGLLTPRRVVMPIAAAGMVFGGMLMVDEDSGILFALVTAAVVICVGLLFRNLGLLAVGGLGALQSIPMAVNAWWPDTLVAPFALVVVGVALVAAAIWTARVRMPQASARPVNSYEAGNPGAALALTAVVLVSVFVVLLWAGLG